MRYVSSSFFLVCLVVIYLFVHKMDANAGVEKDRQVMKTLLRFLTTYTLTAKYFLTYAHLYL